MSARERILARLRKAAFVVSERPRNLEVLRPRFRNDELIDTFCAALEAAAATWEILAETAELPDRVISYAVREGLPGPTAIAPALAKYTWPAALEPQFGTTDGSASLGVSEAQAGIAETGSLVLVSGPDTPTGLNFLPEFQIVCLKCDALVAHLEDAWEVVGWPRPRAINLITGPSRTADVEQTLQLGAHGPRQLHVILCTG